jgi:hypothetical protein
MPAHQVKSLGDCTSHTLQENTINFIISAIGSCQILNRQQAASNRKTEKQTQHFYTKSGPKNAGKLRLILK